MSVFAAAAAVLAADPHLGSAATYTPTGGDAVTLRLVLSRVEDPLGGAGPGALAAGWQAMIPVGALAARPARGDALAVGSRTFAVETAEMDEAEASWNVVLRRTGSWS